jgi:hypothetical protein
LGWCAVFGRMLGIGGWGKKRGGVMFRLFRFYEWCRGGLEGSRCVALAAWVCLCVREKKTKKKQQQQQQKQEQQKRTDGGRTERCQRG